jgi:hypothetical protein
MDERIKELAEQAQTYADEKSGAFRGEIFMRCFTEKFAELVEAAARKDEREACAKLCESMGVHPALNVWGGGPDWYKRQKECAKAIRARENT